MTFDVVVIGELNVDLLLYGEEVAPSFGQVEKLVDDATLAMGRSSAIFAHQATRLGLRVAYRWFVEVGKALDHVAGGPDLSSVLGVFTATKQGCFQ